MYVRSLTYLAGCCRGTFSRNGRGGTSRGGASRGGASRGGTSRGGTSRGGTSRGRARGRRVFPLSHLEKNIHQKHQPKQNTQVCG